MKECIPVIVTSLLYHKRVSSISNFKVLLLMMDNLTLEGVALNVTAQWFQNLKQQCNVIMLQTYKYLKVMWFNIYLQGPPVVEGVAYISENLILSKNFHQIPLSFYKIFMVRKELFLNHNIHLSNPTGMLTIIPKCQSTIIIGAWEI